jgi:4-amino-4-deoxy-L-arabinose transferase-like glycosyltransferase
MSLPHHKKLIIVFLLALILRGSVFVFIAADPQVVLQPDSKMYVLLAQGILQYGSFAYAGSPQEPNVERMPGYPFFLSVIWRIFGQSFMAVIWIQILIDSLSCVLICLIAEQFMEKAGWPAGVFAACNLSMITYAFFILNDSLFVCFFDGSFMPNTGYRK